MRSNRMVISRNQTILFTFLFLIYLLVDLPVSIHQFVYFKWLLNGFLAISGLVWFLWEKDIRFPELSYTFWAIFWTLILLKIGQAFSSNISPVSSTTLDKMTFLPLILLGYNLFLKGKIQLEDILMSIFVSTFIFLILAFIKGMYVGFDRNQLSGYFGNINIAAEFLGISLILQLSTLFKKHLNKSLTIFLYGLSILTSLYLYFASSRSVLIALIISLCVLLISKSISRPRFLKWLSVISVIFCFVVGIGMHLKVDKSIQQSAWIPDLQKSVSTHTRFELIKATLQMIQHNPWGVGPGEFEFAIIPYIHKMMPEFNENVIPHAPHNEYLRLLAEEGIPISLMLIALMGVFLYDRGKKVDSTLRQYPIIGGFFTFWIIQSAFQFPFTNGLSFLVFCLISSFALFKLCSITNEKKNMILPYKPIILYTGAYTALFISICTSEYLTLWQSNISEKSKLAYSLNARNWYAGLNHTQALINQQNYGKAQDLLYVELKKRPHNFVALRQLIDVHFLNKNTNSACRLMKQYDAYFGNNSSYAPLRITTCSAVTADE